MISDELITALAHFFDQGIGPSHDELNRAFIRAGLESAIPTPSQPGEQIGKVRKVRAVLSFALDNDPERGDKAVTILLGAIKAVGGFRPGSDNYPGTDTIESARRAFREAGYELDPDGNLHRTLLDNLEGAELTAALAAYVRRAQRGDSDAALQVGTAKDLVEATARHALVETQGSYPRNQDFIGTLYLAFDRLGLKPPKPEAANLDADAQMAVYQALWILAVALNRLRNAEGTGHGRPFPAKVSEADARLAVQAMGLISGLMLGKLGKTG